MILILILSKKCFEIIEEGLLADFEKPAQIFTGFITSKGTY